MQLLEGHEGPVAALLFAPDGRTLISTGADGTLRSWNAHGESSELSQSDGPLRPLALSGDGKRLATGAKDGALLLWDFAGSMVKIFRPSGSGAVSGLAFLAGDESIAFAMGSDPIRSTGVPGVRVLDLRTGTTRAVPVDQASTGHVKALVYHRERRLLAWATDQRALMFWNISRPDANRLSLKTPCQALAFAHHDPLLAAGSDWKVILTDFERYQQGLVLTGHKGIVSALAFSPDDRLLMTGSGDKTVKYWDPTTGIEKATFAWPIGRVSCVTFSPDGMRAAAAGDMGTIVVWDVDE